jgi:tryptophan-rich sensory protein
MLSQVSSTRQRSLDTTQAAASIVLSTAQPLAAYLSSLTGRGVSEVERARQTDGPVTPADGTFAIWGPLFLGSVTYAGWSALGEHRADPALRRIGWYACGAFAGNIAWSIQAQLSGLGWPSLGFISAAAASANAALFEAVYNPRAEVAEWTLGPLAGWLSLATFANLEATLNDRLGRPDVTTEDRRAAALLCTATAAASAVSAATGGSLPYNAAVAWGLGGTAVRNIRARRPVVAVAALACLGVLGGVALAARYGR